MKIIVTGATGYVGSHVCKLLKEHGHNVLGYDINFHGEYNDVSAYCDKFTIQDITYNNFKEDADAVVHLAGRSVVPQSLKEPSEYYRVNTMGTMNVLQNIETDNFIFAGTSSSWAMASPYARSKVGAEDIIKELATGYTIFRFFNVSGTDGVNRQLGPASHLIRVAAMAAAKKIKALTIYGTDYDTRDGTCIRDYVHVLDLANAIVKAVEIGPMNTPYECLGSKQGWTVREVIKTMKEVTGVNFDVLEGERRLGDSVANTVDTLSDYITLTKTIEDMCIDQYKLEISRNS